jgi:hypothetical protein
VIFTKGDRVRATYRDGDSVIGVYDHCEWEDVETPLHWVNVDSGPDAGFMLDYDIEQLEKIGDP